MRVRAIAVAVLSVLLSNGVLALVTKDPTMDAPEEAASLQLSLRRSASTIRREDTEHELVNSKAEVVQQGAGISVQAVVAEFIAMVLFVVIGCGSAMAIAKEEGSAWVLQVSLTFGLAITALAYTVVHFSGGHINSAVTLGLMIAGKCSIAQGLLNMLAQLVGAIAGSLILLLMFEDANDKTAGLDNTGGLATNAVGKTFSKMSAIIGEIMMTFLLVFVVLQTATNPRSEANRPLACLAIGLSVFLAHSVLIPLDGCSINPTRSVGPAIVAKLFRGKQGVFEDLWIFVVAPLFGAALAAGVALLLG